MDRSPPREPDPKPTLDDFWAFRTMLTPWLIQVIFWMGVIACEGVGLYVIRGAGVFEIGRVGLERVDLAGVLGGLVWMLCGPVVVRLVCEAIIVVFRINETLTEIKNKMK